MGWRMMQRLDDWPARLIAHVDGARNKPFKWGGSDCCLFACDGIQVMTGVDVAAHFRDLYRTKIQAYGSLKRFAGGGLVETAVKITTDQSMTEIAPAFAQRGDLFLIHADPDNVIASDALALCYGDHLVAQGRAGVEELPLSRASRAWKV